MSQRKVMPKSPKSSEAFQKDWTSPLHSKPAQQLKTGPQINALWSEVLTRASSHALAIDGRHFCPFLLITILTCYFSAAARPNIIRGPDPTLTPLQEGNNLVPSSNCQPLFLPGTDNEEEQVPEDLVAGEAALFEDDGLADNFSNLDNGRPTAPQDEPMDLDRDSCRVMTRSWVLLLWN